MGRPLKKRKRRNGEEEKWGKRGAINGKSGPRVLFLK